MDTHMTILIETLADLARRAGAITLQYYQTGIQVETKADESPVTIADRNTEKFLREEIAKLFPDDCVMGEEFGESAGKPGARKWIVDPIDGTKSFVRGVPLYGVMIGVEEAGEIVAGAVYMPALGELVVAAKGAGCWWNGRPAKVSTKSSLAEGMLCTTDAADNHKSGKGTAYDQLCAASKLVRTWGDCYGHLLVATGRAEVMIDPIMSPWDCAALKIILEEAGGTFTDYEGKPTIYGNCAIGTNGAVFNEVMTITRKSKG